MEGFKQLGMLQRRVTCSFTANALLNRGTFWQHKDYKPESCEERQINKPSDKERNMKKLSFSRSVNKCETSSSLDYTQIKAVKTRWAGRLGDAKRALSRKAKGFSSTATSSSTPCLVSTAPPPPKRAPSTTLTLRSKSMTAELEELGECLKTGEQTQHSLPPFVSYFLLDSVIKIWRVS